MVLGRDGVSGELTLFPCAFLYIDDVAHEFLEGS